MRKIDKKDINKVLLRSQLIQMSHNYERMQSLSSLYALAPIAKKIYGENGKNKETQNFMKRHLEYFNTHPVFAPLIFGIVSALEETTDEDNKKKVLSVKTGLMGPLAGLGDSLLNFTWYPIAGGIGASLAVNGNYLGPIIMFLMINLLYNPLKYYSIHYGYQKGIELLQNKKTGLKLLERFSNLANVLGMVVIGGLIASNVKMNVILSIPVTEGEPILIQSMLDRILPSLLPVIVTWICYYTLKKSKGAYAVKLIFSILIIGIILTYFKILG